MAPRTDALLWAGSFSAHSNTDFYISDIHGEPVAACHFLACAVTIHVHNVRSDNPKAVLLTYLLVYEQEV